MNQKERNQEIVKTSIVGILANVLLAASKAAVGLLSNSIAIVLDAINNLSDAASSIITIIGAKLAGKDADRKHPFGYGRAEYLSALVISLLVLYAGITSLTESVKKILNPGTPEYSKVTLLVVALAVIVKIVLGQYVKRRGVKLNSESLINSGQDASMDAIISASTLASAVIYLIWNISLEAWLGAIISLIIIKSGIDMIRDTLSDILGERADASIVAAVKKTVCSFPEVLGAYDLVLHDYGPDTYNGSIHIEVPDTLTVKDLDVLERHIMEKVYIEHKIILTGIGIYSQNTQDDDAQRVQNEIREIVMGTEYVIQMHGFYLNRETKSIRFDAVISFDTPDRRAVQKEMLSKLTAKYPDYQIVIALDLDFTDLGKEK